jgi:hypothetical protein
VAISDNERGIDDRARENRGHVDLVPLKDTGLKVLVRVLPRERLLLDEVAITPSKKVRQQDRARAKAILAQAAHAQPVSDHEIEKLQKRLGTESRQEALRGVESKRSQESQALAEVRRSKIVKQAADVLAKAKSGRPLRDGDLERLQQSLLTMERQDELAGRASEGRQLAEALSEIRREQVVRRARDALTNPEKGRSLTDTQVEKLQQKLLGMERQDELGGKDSEGFQLAYALGELRQSRLLEEGQRVLERARKGKVFSEEHLIKLQQGLGTMGRQQEMLGEENEERWLVSALGDVRRAQVVKDARRVLEQGKKGKRFSKGRITALQQRLLTINQQAEKLGEELPEEWQMAFDLTKLRR